MRILVCAEEAPIPPFNGIRAPLAGLIERLRSSNDVRVLAYRMSDQSVETTEQMRILARPASGAVKTASLFARSLVGRRPLRPDWLAEKMAPALAQELARFRPDVVHVAAGRLGALAPDLEGRASVLWALDAPHLNVEARASVASPVKRRLLRGEAARWRRFEGRDWARFGAVVVVSREDADALRAVDPRMAVHVIPGGIEADRFAPRPQVEREAGRLVFHGVLDYAPNVAAARFLAREIVPLVRARRPHTELVIVGRSPAPQVHELDRLDGVRIEADVPDVADWLTSASVYVCPMLSGTGIKNKLLEAMANELPCVVTPLALRGISAMPGRDVLVGENPDELTGNIIRLLDDDALARSVGASGRAYVIAEHDWSVIARSYETLYRRLADRTLGTRAHNR